MSRHLNRRREHGSRMRQIDSAEQVMNTLARLQAGSIEPSDALLTLGEVFLRELQTHKVPPNTQNAGQIAFLLASKLSPDDPMSKITRQLIATGRFPDFSTEEPEEHSVIRGCAGLISLIKGSSSSGAPKSACLTLLQFIEDSGYLPKECIE